MDVKIGDLVTLDKIEEQHVCMVIAQCQTLDEAARVLGVNVSTLHRKRKKWSMPPPKALRVLQKASL
jgi:two-component system, NtrC family, response regulator AlgB